MYQRNIIIILIIIFSANSINFIFADDLDNFQIKTSIDPRVYGANLSIDLFMDDFPPASYLHSRLDGVIQSEGFHRNPDGSLFFGNDTDDLLLAKQTRIAAGLRLGPVIGLTPQSRRTTSEIELFNILATSIEYRLPKEDINQLIFQTNYPDKAGSWTNLFLFGIRRNTIRDSARYQKGMYSEISAQYAPWWLGNSVWGAADFFRLHARHIIYHPLSIDNLFWINGTYFDQLWQGSHEGSTIPLYHRGSIGGWDERRAMGGLIRGFEKNRFDSDTKLANAMDIRYLLPEYTKLKLQPGIIAYWDIGYYRNLHDAPDDEYNKGWISSYGGGISLRIMDTATFALYIHNAWFGNTTIEDDRITYFELDFGFHQ